MDDFAQMSESVGESLNDPILSFDDYSFMYPEAKRPALCDVDLDVHNGEFLLVCGTTGSGKTTLLRAMKPEIAPMGVSKGSLSLPAESMAVGFVAQDPENQIVMDSAWHELAFGLENMGIPAGEIRRRIAEMASFFGIDPWIEKKVFELSGGQKQILNLASVLVMQPQILVLDEPTAQLDPIAAKEFLQILARTNKELGITVVVSEHRLDDVLSLADRVAFVNEGAVTIYGSPGEFACEGVRGDAAGFERALPAPVRVAQQLGATEAYPLNVREGREWLASCGLSLRCACSEGCDQERLPEGVAGKQLSPALEAKNLWFRYSKSSGFVLRDTSFAVDVGEIHVILGTNGSGKTTLLTVLAGGRKPNRGVVRTKSGLTLGLLSQDPKSLFVTDTVLGELEEWKTLRSYQDSDVEEMLDRFGLADKKERHPYDLSGGEMQKLALAKVLLLSPDVLLLDEPTKGVDAKAKEDLAQVFLGLKTQGITVAMVTHDVEFAASCADRCSLLFGGNIVCSEPAREFFGSNMFYTTEVERMTRGLVDGCMLVEDVIADE